MKTVEVKIKEVKAPFKWVLDPVHSEIQFTVKHMMITNVKGEFRNYDIEIEGDDFPGSKILVRLYADSISTNNADRDIHLKSADFFDAEKFPELTFESTSFKKTDDTNYKLTGIFTMKGISKEITLDAEFGGINTDPWGNVKAGFSVSGKINRKDWGLNWNGVLETGGVLVSEEVRLNAEIQFIKQSRLN